MTVRKCVTSITIFITLTSLGRFDEIAAERWSRQVSNSEWIPLANPRTASGQVSQRSGLLSSGTHLSSPIQSLALPPALQHQYQEQLIQLQKTQESIQKLLLLQQQLKAQQQLLQSQTYLPNGYSNTEDEKQALPPSSLSSLQTEPELAPEVLVPPSSDALPPIYSPQTFLSQRPGQIHQPNHHAQDLSSNREFSSLPVQGQGQVVLQHGVDVNADNTQEDPHNYIIKQGSQKLGGKRLKGQTVSELQQPGLIENVGDEEEEVQLVYVPAETLAQRGQPKRNRGRKQYRQQHQQREHQESIEQTSLSPDQEAFARQVLQQIQKEHEEKAQFLKEERVKEFTRLNEEQKALERKTRLQQEALQREQELLRQKEAEKKRKELERLEEMAKQRELVRIREAREKQRQEELERRRLAELRVKDEKRREEEIREHEDRQKKLELERNPEGQQEAQLHATSPGMLHQNAQSQAQIREQARRQHLTDSTKTKKIRGRPRQRINQYQEQTHYREVTTTPSPNQPPLSVYMGSLTSKLETVKITDVLKILKDAKSIAVLDNVGSSTPQVFVGPSNLDPPYGYAKFDLPYLSSIDHNRVERKVDKLPFFVAPLSFDPPPGYSKIPFPAPHIGSVVVNTLSEPSSESDIPANRQNPGSTPLIEPNSYSDIDQSGSIATTASYGSPTTQDFSPESNGPKYESAYSTPPSGSRFRFRQFYDNKPTHSISTSYYGEQSTPKTRSKQYYEQESKLTTQPPKVDTMISYRQEVSYSNTPNFRDRTASSYNSSTKEQNLAQLALINQELAQQREAQKYNTAEQYYSPGESYDVNEVRAPVGPAQYNLPAELPPISPHLPGLVNSLLDKQEENIASTSPETTTTATTMTPTTTTTRVSSTTYRPRGRSRVVTTTRPKTTQSPSSRTSTDRIRRPYSRSKSRFTTTTENYTESSYEPTKAKTPETTQKYTVEHRRPSSRTQKYRGRDRTSSQPTVHDQNENVQVHQIASYENYPTQSDLQSNTSPSYPPISGSTSNLRQKETSSADFVRENYRSTTPTQTENYPPLREVTIQHGPSPLVSDDYSRSQNYPQSRPQDVHYHGITYDRTDALEQPPRLEKTPVNGFNYQVGNEESSDRTIPRLKEFYQEKLEDPNLAGTENPRTSDEHRYSPIYEVNVAQTQPNYNVGEQNTFRNIEDSKIENDAVETDLNAPPIFVPLQQSKQEDYELQIPSTEIPLIEITTTSTTTPAPVIIRQRVRARLGGGRTHHDSAIQARPRGSQDEYVRFNAVNHDSGRSSTYRHREGSRTRTRARPQSHGSQVQTEGNEYIKIHAAQQQRLVATTVPAMTTVVTTTTPRPLEEDVDYGFIKPPNFRPVHSADNRFQAPVTYRPALSEIQHLISNDETAVESSPTHVLKNRNLKYHQFSSRRPITKTLTTTTTIPNTTTEAVPVATTMPDNTVYTVRPKTKTEESKSTRVRGRVRRPGKKRTTTTTESGLEANNELPLNENYPQRPQQLPMVEAGQQPLYDDNFDVSPQFVANQNRPTQFYEEIGENYPPQEFILNFSNLPEQVSQREEFDQTQLGSVTFGRHSHSDRAIPISDTSSHSTGDIYGSESQWSTKLSKTSFQPNFASNHMTDETRKNRDKNRNDQHGEDVPEIITAGPEASSVTVVVSADYQKHIDGAGGMDATNTTVFGRKTNAQDHTLNFTTAVTNLPTTILQNKIQENSTEQMDDLVKRKEDIPSGQKSGTRRRRVRVRVRPAKDDFVTSESQHFNSAMNNLVQDRHKYNSIRDSKFTTVQSSATTTPVMINTYATQKSLLQGFLEEMLKNDEVSIPTRVTSVTTKTPDWKLSTPIPYVISEDNGEFTTLKENYVSGVTTPTLNADKENIVNNNSARLREGSKETISFREPTSRLSQEEVKEQNEIKLNNLEKMGMFTPRYKLSSNYPNSSETSKEIEDTVVELTGFPAVQEEIRKLNTVNNPVKEKEHIMTLKRQEANIDRNEAHPKNHRPKWSEVKYPSASDKSQSVKLLSTTPIPGVIARNEGNASVKTLSDYVKAIFDSMKSAENEEVVAKVIEAKNKIPTDNSNTKETEGNEETETTDLLQDTFTTQRVKINEHTMNSVEMQSVTGMTTKESAITYEDTTLIPDTSTNALVSPEENATTEPSTIASTTKTTSIRRTGSTANSMETMLGKVLRTSTTTKISHMTEICYRGRCVMTKPIMEDATR